MKEQRFEVDLPGEILAGFGWVSTEVPGKVRETLIMELLRRDQISEAQAVALLDIDRWQLLDLMGQYRVPAIWLNSDELQKELAQGLLQSPTDL